MPSPAPAPDDSPRLRAILEEVRRRLRDICGDMPVRDFEAMTDRMARLQYKYEMRREHDGL